ncbi:beta-phosphoglucomutase family hydrolase [Aggregatibacter actinomycetemcomitans]|uniref:beta-phosphoglucomutase family hydrolase n=1 Tax=Aggregatibacter actinomycetemcomitans TaxID=714 RepID=UPI0011D9D5B3|nr:beta-phosphoglucomutase family hydrolase [Aggregatibacter actinomycetemcomitans]QEH44431.1 beta-phosphoglucomutase family hydrolase [Aggregatibacter actinomycetemcomitans]QEH48506.1 beta-phosphoglucomutase family hydrolase [Aggregatibacter actinomycetemcomitans]TYA50360.1 beta-phosphoglucomutase family hydrolase [Aggregatibacter actinomycetemcomitans]TYB28798.1 beta-phosphoglucomutase family hydrolase [Aggregatibacter actinomycetemcomitans]
MLDNDVINQYDGLIFDMDGTVIDTMPSHAKAWEMVGQHFGYPFDGNLLYELGGAPVKTIAQEMMKRHAMPLERLDDVIHLKREYGKQLIMQHATLLPAASVVRSFYSKKPLALGTGSHRAMTEILLDKFDFEKYFSAIVTAEDIQHHKPAPDTFLRCAELIKVKPRRCLVFEDGDLGIQAGLRAGMDVFDVRVNKLLREN